MMKRLRVGRRYIRYSCFIILCMILAMPFLVGLLQTTVDVKFSGMFSNSLFETTQPRTGILRELLQTELVPIPKPGESVSHKLEGWVVLPGNITIHVGISNNPHNFSYIINNENRCKQFHQQYPKLLIFIESSANNSHRRQAIRETWGVQALQDALNFRLMFMLGAENSQGVQEKVIAESYIYGDIVQENFEESFQNLALKSVMGLKWAVTYCPEADFVLKTDDDIFIHVPNLIQALKPSRTSGLLMCHENKARRILRKTMWQNAPISYWKYMVDQQELPGAFFPRYCAGLGYVMSLDVVKKLYKASLQTPYHFIEDVYITGFCREKAGLSLQNHEGFTLRPEILPHQASCAFRDGRITSQEVNATEMRELWSQLNTQGFFCPEVIGYISK